jgi:hypothetical protein
LSANEFGSKRLRYCAMLTLLLLGCHSKLARVHPTDDGRYTVTAETMSQASNGAAVARHDAEKIANKFCEKKERAANTEAFEDQTTSLSYVSTLIFTCR